MGSYFDSHFDTLSRGIRFRLDPEDDVVRKPLGWESELGKMSREGIACDKKRRRSTVANIEVEVVVVGVVI